jgi:hypothetical protein
MSSPRIHYSQRPDTATEAESPALAAVYRFIIDCHAKKEVAFGGRPNDVRNTKSCGEKSRDGFE